MKIGILTFHNIPNFGAVLQAYSLCVALRQIGGECEIINYRCENIVFRELTYHKHPNRIKDIIIKLFIWPITKKKIKGCQAFMQQAGVYGTEQYDKKTIFEANSKYDIFLSGSDMIWDLSVTNFDTTYFLDFTEKAKLRYSYGSSCGDTIWDDKSINDIRTLLNRYNGIAVREENMKKKLETIAIQSYKVADPTMLLTPQQWAELAKPPRIKDYVLVYFPSDKNLKAASQFASRTKSKVVVLNWGAPMRGFKNASPNTPQEWIGYIMNATAIFTDSYHGLLFSLYFNKPVWVGKEGSRFDSLLSSLGIMDVYLTNDLKLHYNINYGEVNKLIYKMRNESFDYLKSFLNV